MTKRNSKGKTAGPKMGSPGCCDVDAVVTVDERGQIVLPKEVRRKIGIKPGDKMAVVSYAKDEQTCCVILMKIGGLAGMVKIVLSPMAKDVLGE